MRGSALELLAEARKLALAAHLLDGLGLDALQLLLPFFTVRPHGEGLGGGLR